MADRFETELATHSTGLCVIDAARGVASDRARMLAAGALAAGALVYVARVDPHRTRLVWPRCPVKFVTGLDCPGCGGMRMAHDLVHGDVRMALHDNPYLLACSPVLAALLWRRVATPTRGALPAPLAYGIGLSALVWMAVRNVPCWPLRPAVRD